jgi:hypothetical protein
MGPVSWWAVISSSCAPVLLIGGSTIATVVEGPTYNPVRQTISVLAAGNTAAYWALTATLIALGVCYLATAWGLRAAKPAGRVALGAAGIAAMVLAWVPAPLTGGSLSHGTVVAVGFSLMTLWPILASDRSGNGPWGLRPVPSLAAAALMVAGSAWFLVEIQVSGAAGVAERVLTCAQALWPVVVVVSCLRHSAAPVPEAGTPGSTAKGHGTWAGGPLDRLGRREQGVQLGGVEQPGVEAHAGEVARKLQGQDTVQPGPEGQGPVQR